MMYSAVNHNEILIEIYFTCYTDHCFPYKEHSFHLSKWCQVFGKKKTWLSHQSKVKSVANNAMKIKLPLT